MRTGAGPPTCKLVQLCSKLTVALPVVEAQGAVAAGTPSIEAPPLLLTLTGVPDALAPGKGDDKAAAGTVAGAVAGAGAGAVVGVEVFPVVGVEEFAVGVESGVAVADAFGDWELRAELRSSVSATPWSPA